MHGIAGALAMLTVIVFWSSTAVSELFLDAAAVTAVKRGIAVYGLAVMVLLMMMTGASGFGLGRGNIGKLVTDKRKRMRFVAANGILVMIPCALYLYGKSASGQFDAAFYGVQTIELAAGLVQLILMGMNFRDGLAMTGKLRKRRDLAGKEPHPPSALACKDEQ
jgi:hypothetical protein